MISLTERQKAIISMLPRCRCVADIGCDHGYLGAYILQTGLARQVIASDISLPSLKKAEALAARLGLDAMQVRHCAGFDGIEPQEFDCAVIAGMGGGTIADILRNYPFDEHTLVLQPMNGFAVLKQALSAKGLCVLDEQVVCEDKRLYQVMLVRKGQYSPSKSEIALPMLAVRRRDENARLYIERRLATLLTARQKSNNADIAEGIIMLQEALEWYR